MGKPIKKDDKITLDRVKDELSSKISGSLVTGDRTGKTVSIPLNGSEIMDTTEHLVIEINVNMILVFIEIDCSKISGREDYKMIVFPQTMKQLKKLYKVLSGRPL
jgi:hypothetical protein